MTLEQLKNSIDTAVNNRLSTIANIQANYLTNRGRYFQGIRTPQTIPEDGNNVAVDLTLRPYYQPESWQDVGITLNASIPFQIGIHQYKTPLSQFGYMIFLRFIYGGKLYGKTICRGVDEYTIDWFEFQTI